MHCIIYTPLLLQAAWSVKKISGRGQGDIDAGGAQGRDLEGVGAGLLQQASRPHRLEVDDLFTLVRLVIIIVIIVIIFVIIIVVIIIIVIIVVIIITKL